MQYTKQYTNSKIDSRAPYEAPQSDLVSIVGGGRVLNTSATNEDWDYGDYEW